jgi:hypothetical protein
MADKRSKADRLWALRILRLFRHKEIADDHPDARKAYRIIGYDLAQQIIAGTVEPGPKPRGGKRRNPLPSADVMWRRLPGSFESSGG